MCARRFSPNTLSPPQSPPKKRDSAAKNAASLETVERASATRSRSMFFLSVVRVFRASLFLVFSKRADKKKVVRRRFSLSFFFLFLFFLLFF
jgi:hypothetical protein